MKTYEVIESSPVLNLDNETMSTLEIGEKITGEFVLIDEKPFVETGNGYVSTDGLAEKLESNEADLTENTVKASHKKLIFALVGGGVGFGIAHFMKKDLKVKVMFTVAGIALGLGVDYVNNRKK